MLAQALACFFDAYDVCDKELRKQRNLCFQHLQPQLVRTFNNHDSIYRASVVSCTEPHTSRGLQLARYLRGQRVLQGVLNLERVWFENLPGSQKHETSIPRPSRSLAN
jgi:hypothetical protein